MYEMPLSYHHSPFIVYAPKMLKARAYERPYAYFCADNKIGVLDSEFFLLLKDLGEKALYQYATQSTENVIEQHKYRADSLRNYAISNMQIYSHLLTNNQQFFTIIK